MKGGKSINKGDLVNEIAKVVNTKKETQSAVDCVFSTITNALKRNMRLHLLILAPLRWHKKTPGKEGIHGQGKK